MDHLKRGEFSKISKHAVEELFANFETDVDGNLSLKELQDLIDRVVIDNEMQMYLKHMLAAGDKDNNGVITVDEFHQALKLGSANEVENLLKVMRGEKESDGCTSEVLHAYLTEKISTNQNCISLPFYIIFFGLIWLLTLVHLEVFYTHRQNSALKTVLLDAPKLNSLWWKSPDGLWDWADLHILPALFESIPKGRLTTNNQLVGGLLMERTDAETIPCQPKKLQELYGGEEDVAICYGDLKENKEAEWFPLQESIENHKGHLQTLRSTWLTDATRSIDVSLVSYNGQNGFLTSTRLTFAVENGGHWLFSSAIESFSADPYDHEGSDYGLLIFLDIMFCIMSSLILVFEVKALIALKQVSTGIGFKNAILKYYVSFWKVIDWTNIIQSFSIVIHWALDVSRTLSVAEDLLKLPKPGDAGYGDPPVELYERVYKASWAYGNLRWYVTVFTVTSMIRFFKAFRANARLNIVTRTIIVASKDLAHFAIVFLSIFFAFVLMGHLLYGPRVSQFSRLSTACDSCVMMLVGFLLDDIRADMLQSTGGTGVAWIYAYIVIMQLLLLNMILVVIFDVYAEVKGNVHNAPTLYEQAFQLVAQKRNQYLRVKKAKAALSVRASTAPGLEEGQSPYSGASSGDSATIGPRGSLLKGKTVAELEKMVHEVSDSDILGMLQKASLHDREDFAFVPHSKEIEWTIDLLSSKLDGMSTSQAKDLIRDAKEFAKAEQGEGEGLSLYDTIRLIARVDANVQEVMRTMQEQGTRGDKDSAQQRYSKVMENTRAKGRSSFVSNLESEFDEAKDDFPEYTDVTSSKLPPVPPSQSNVNGANDSYYGFRLARIVE